jgi:hypothetical protein
MLNCHDATRMISESQERRLGHMERVSLRLHLALCAACRRFERQLPLLRQAMRSFRNRAG